MASSLYRQEFDFFHFRYYTIIGMVKDSLIIVKPETVVSWHREGFKLSWNFISRRSRRGWPCTEKKIRDLIRKIARENPTWGAPRIHGEFHKLGYSVSERTVSRYLPT